MEPGTAMILQRKTVAFTLVELLVVVSIMVVIAGLVAPAANTMLRSSQITQSADAITAQLSSARQNAMTTNRAMEVRFYKLADPSLIGNTRAVRAIQVFKIEDNGDAKPEGRSQWLPGSMLIDSEATLSPLLASARKKSWPPSPPPVDPKLSLPRAGTDYDAFCFRFRPDGSTDLDPTSKWFVTVHAANDGDDRTTLPANFATIQVDPINSSLKLYRP
jgi:uncharacterized protein (TIGR02596 family)